MWPLIMAALSAMGMGGGSAALGGAVIPTATAAAGGTSALGGISALGAGATGLGGAVLPSAMAGGTGLANVLSKFAPNLTGMGQNLANGNFQGAGVNAANMVGGENLANMVSNPSWNNLGKIGEGMGDKMASNMVTQGLMGTPQQQTQPPSPGATSNPKVAQAPQQIQDNPILQKMYNNLNPQFQATPMKPWPASPYPKRMSAI